MSKHRFGLGTVPVMWVLPFRGVEYLCYGSGPTGLDLLEAFGEFMLFCVFRFHQRLWGMLWFLSGFDDSDP